MTPNQIPVGRENALPLVLDGTFLASIYRTPAGTVRAVRGHSVASDLYYGNVTDQGLRVERVLLVTPAKAKLAKKLLAAAESDPTSTSAVARLLKLVKDVTQ